MCMLSPLGTALQNTGLALMIGGMLALGAFTAPVLFKTMARPEAGEAMTVIFRRYDIVLLVSVLLVLAGEALRVWAQGGMPVLGLWSGVRYGVLTLLVACTLFSTLKINAQIESAQKAGIAATASVEEVRKFNKVHTLSEKLYKLQLYLALALLVMTPFVQRTMP